MAHTSDFFKRNNSKQEETSNNGLMFIECLLYWQNVGNIPTIRKCSIKKYDESFYKNFKQLFQWETVYDVIIAMIPWETDPEMEIYAQECY